MSGQKISPKRFERITDAQAAMTDIVVTSAAKIQRKRKCTTCFARKMSKHAVKHKTIMSGHLCRLIIELYQIMSFMDFDV
jgi:hypothetical protein